MTGATSNPTIFAKAITGTDLYDEQLRELAAAGVRDSQERFFALALDDIREAAGNCGPRTTVAAGATDSSRSSARRTSPTAPRGRSRRRSTLGSG